MQKTEITSKLDIFANKKVLKSALNETREYYRPLDPGSYLYGLIMKFPNTKKFTKTFIELVYTTLSAWNMNSRGARLQEFSLFRESIMKCKSKLARISNLTLKSFDTDQVRESISDLFENLNLVFEDKPPLVTFSKTMHFYLPNLIVPIDRTYTMNFFYGNTNVPDTNEKQLERFFDIQQECCRFSKENKLGKYKDRIWNRSIPKIIDNAIIGHIRIERE